MGPLFQVKKAVDQRIQFCNKADNCVPIRILCLLILRQFGTNLTKVKHWRMFTQLQTSRLRKYF